MSNPIREEWTSADGQHRIIWGDCSKVLPLLDTSEVAAVLADPPYGLERFKKGFGTTRFNGHGCETQGIVWDRKPEQATLERLIGIAPAIIWGGNNFPLPTSESFFVWDKMQTVDNFASAELAWSNVGMPAKVFRYSINQHNANCVKEHPTQKPVALMIWCLSFLPPGLILDPYAGSCTVAVACARTGRRSISIEIEERYYRIGIERMERELARHPLFDPPKPKQLNLLRS